MDPCITWNLFICRRNDLTKKIKDNLKIEDTIIPEFSAEIIMSKYLSKKGHVVR